MDRTERLSSQLSFVLEIDRLKSVVRQTYLVDGSRRENSAEHSWHLAMMALLLAEHANEPVNVERVVQLVLVHDLVEIGAGDTYAYGGADPSETRLREEEAAKSLFLGKLPEEQGASLYSLWKEFDEGSSPEARFALALDRLMPMLHNFHAHGRSWLEHGVTAGQVRARMAPMREGSESLWHFTQQLIDKAVQEGFLPEEEG